MGRKRRSVAGIARVDPARCPSNDEWYDGSTGRRLDGLSSRIAELAYQKGRNDLREELKRLLFL